MSFWYGGVGGSREDRMLVVGPDGYALATAEQPSPHWIGLMQSRLFVPHVIVLPTALASALLLLTLARRMGKAAAR